MAATAGGGRDFFDGAVFEREPGESIRLGVDQLGHRSGNRHSVLRGIVGRYGGGCYYHVDIKLCRNRSHDWRDNDFRD
jgi:hypothetical protein